MDLHPQHPTYLLNSPQRPKSLENSRHELLSSRVTETQPSQAASTLVLREKGLREGEKTGVEGCLHTWASQIPQFTEQREREGILQTTIKHTLIMPELEPFKHQMSWKHHYIRQAVEEKPPHGMNGDNMDLEEFVNDLPWLIDLLILFTYSCLVPRRFLFSIPKDCG